MITAHDVMHPPVLQKVTVLPVQLEGTWVSRMCETQPLGMFLMRQVAFVQEGSTWRCYYHFFTDANCKSPSYSIYASGDYVFLEEYPPIRGAERYHLLVTDLKITPQDPTTVTNLNGDVGNDCAMDGSWRLGVEQDVTSTNGCATLGISIPYVQADLIRMLPSETKEGSLLFMGKQPSDGRFRSTYRPTSFQEPLFQCKEEGRLGLRKSVRHASLAGVNSADTFANSPAVALYVFLVYYMCTNIG